MNPTYRRLPAWALLLLTALSSGVQAQTDGSVYGVVDFSYGRFEPSGALPRHRFNSNSLTASFAGVNVKQGFESGWTAGLTLEGFVRFQDFEAGRNRADPVLSRNAFVSWSGREGSFRLGRLQTFLFDATVRFNALGNSVAFSPALRHIFASGNLQGVQGDFYWNRAVSYQSPSLEGISASVMAGQGNNNNRGDLLGGTLVVNQGLLALGLSAQSVKINPEFADPTDEQTWQLGATYNFGLARVFAQFTATRDHGLDVRSQTVSAGVNLALGPGNVVAQAAQSTTTGPAVDRKHSTATLGYLYPYDSVTDLYLLGMDDRVRGQTRGLSAAAGVRWRF